MTAEDTRPPRGDPSSDPPPTVLDEEAAPAGAGEGASALDPPPEPAPPASSPTRLDAADAPPTRLDGEAPGPGAGAGTDARALPEALAGAFEPLGPLDDSGGEAELLLVRRRSDGERLVVKLYARAHERDERTLEALRRADPAHVVRIEDVGRDERGRWWELMEHCERGSLRALAGREGPRLAPERLREVVAEIASALAHLHDLGIPHTDLKPANVLVRSDRPLDLVLADFGGARRLAASKELRSGLLATPDYLSPEAIGFRDPEDGRYRSSISYPMDFWALGVICCELATGRHPLRQADGEPLPAQVIVSQIASRPLDLSGIADERLALLCRGLTVRDPERRWGAREVGAWLSGESPAVAVEEGAAAQPIRLEAHPFRFADPETGRTRPYRDPAELARAMARRWEEAAALFSGRIEARRSQRDMIAFLRSTGRAEGERVFADQDEAEARLTRLLVHLDPAMPPVFRGYAIDAEGLVRLAAAAAEDEQAAEALEAIQDIGILSAWARSPAHADLAEIDARWQEASEEFEAALARGVEDDGERRGLAAVARASLLEAVLDETRAAGILETGRRAVADRQAILRPWFAELGGEVDPQASLGGAFALTVLAIVARREVEAAERERVERDRAAAAERRERERSERRERRSRAGRSLRSGISPAMSGALVCLVVLLIANGIFSSGGIGAIASVVFGVKAIGPWLGLSLGLIVISAAIYNFSGRGERLWGGAGFLDAPSIRRSMLAGTVIAGVGAYGGATGLAGVDEVPSSAWAASSFGALGGHLGLLARFHGARPRTAVGGLVALASISVLVPLAIETRETAASGDRLWLDRSSLEVTLTGPEVQCQRRREEPLYGVAPHLVRAEATCWKRLTQVTYSWYRGGEIASSVYGRLRGEAADRRRAGARRGACKDGRLSLNGHWWRGDDPDDRLGDMFCAPGPNGTWQIVWTIKPSNLLAVASRPHRGEGARRTLYRDWRRLPAPLHLR